MGEALVLRDIRAGYGSRTVIDDLCVELPCARVTAVLGPGGSGKSTLLRMLAGSWPELWSSGQLPQLSSWLLPQATRTNERRGLDPELVTAARADLRAWLAEHPNMLTPDGCEALCMSERAVVRVQRILAAVADVLLLDEPDGDLDERAGLALASLLRQLARAGQTILLVTHNLTLLDHVADHVLLLVDGVKLDEGPLARVRSLPASERVRDFFTWGT